MTNKWNTPYEWFMNYIEGKDIDEIRLLLLEFAQDAGFAAIQDKFQAMMEDEDEYFEYFEEAEEGKSPSLTPCELGKRRAHDDRDKSIYGVPYSVCPFRENDKRRADWAYGYLDGKGHNENDLALCADCGKLEYWNVAQELDDIILCETCYSERMKENKQ